MNNNNQNFINQNNSYNAMNNNNFSNMNNMNFINNNMNKNNNNYNQNNIIQNQNQNNTNYNIDGIIWLTFTFPAYNKDICIDFNENETFNKVIDKLKKKYIYLNRLKDLKFVYNNKEIDGNRTVKQNGLNESNKIIIQYYTE